MGLGWAEYETKNAATCSCGLFIYGSLTCCRGDDLDGKLPPADYYAYLSRFTHRPYTDVWAIGLRDRLPVLPVPLLPPDEDVVLDLQRAADTCYDLVHYERLLRGLHSLPPRPVAAARASAAPPAGRS